MTRCTAAWICLLSSLAMSVALGGTMPPPTVTTPLGQVAVNKWTTVYSGPPGIIGVHARFLWLPDMKRGFLWPCYDYKVRAYNFKQHLTLHLYDPAAGTWSQRPSTVPKGWETGRDVIANSYVYLPGLKRILVLRTGGLVRSRETCLSWLLDPVKGAWEPLRKQPRMGDLSAAFNPAGGAGGSPIPLWGMLVYDALNQQAVSIGGGGTWGRVGAAPEPVQVGDWIYDQAMTPKRIRRLTTDDLGEDGTLKIARARKWYPANAGTWVFPEKTKTWAAIGQPLREQPPGRVLPAAAYAAGPAKIVMFGGDDFQKPLGDTWIYDCKTHTWSEARPKAAPPARAAHVMIYLPDQNAVLLAGGYGPGWVWRKDVWAYDLAKNEWSRLGLDLPVAAQYGSMAYDPHSNVAVLSLSRPRWGRNKTSLLLGLKLDLKTAPRAPAPEPVQLKQTYHCKHTRWSSPLPEEWDSPKNRSAGPEAGRKVIAALPANTWVVRKQPMNVRARQWGKYIYDRRTHKAYAWGGGHYGYIGADVSEYDVLTNRWRSMNDPVNYKLLWQHPSAGGSPGVSFQGWRLMGTHARKSYHVDPLSNSVITIHGEVFSIKHQRYVATIGRCPGGWGASGQHAYVTTPHGLYAFAADRSTRQGGLRKANVAAGKWDLIATGGPNRHHEYDTLCYDARRDRLLWTRSKDAAIWQFDFKTKKWAQEKPDGPAPGSVLGDACYVDDLDAAMWVFGPGRNPQPKMYFYKLDQRKWYTAPYAGAKIGWYANLNNSPCYDPQLKLFVRLTHSSRDRFVEVAVMRLDPASITLTPVKPRGK